MTVFNEELIACNLQASNVEEVVQVLAQKLVDQDLVAADYGERVMARERIHPTGLPTRPFPIAFPHADADGVIKSALALASLQKPVVFRSMEDPDEELAVKIVIMMANNSPEDQIDTLRNLAILFGRPEKLQELSTLSSTQDILPWMRRELNLDD